MQGREGTRRAEPRKRREQGAPSPSPARLGSPGLVNYLWAQTGRAGAPAALRCVSRARAAPHRAALAAQVWIRGRAGGYGQGENAAGDACRPAARRHPLAKGEGAAAGPRLRDRPALGSEAPGRGAQLLRGGGRSAPRRCAPFSNLGGGRVRAALARSRCPRPLVPSNQAFVISLHPPAGRRDEGEGRKITHEGRDFCPSLVPLYVIICLYD